MEPIKSRPASGPEQMSPEMLPEEGLAALSPDDHAMTPGAEASVHAWTAHESNAVSAAMRESLLGATGTMPDDPMTMQEFYSLTSPVPPPVPGNSRGTGERH